MQFAIKVSSDEGTHYLCKLNKIDEQIEKIVFEASNTYEAYDKISDIDFCKLIEVPEEFFLNIFELEQIKNL